VKYDLMTRASYQIWAFYANVARRTHTRRGASLVEYVLLISLLALACFVGLKYLGSATSRPYSGAASGLDG
jgi:hypothetical protein